MRGNSVRPLAAKEAEALFQLCLWLQVTVVKWNMRAHPDLNQGPADLQSAALTTELCTQVLVGVSRSNKLQTVLPKKGPESRSTTTNLRRLKPSSTQAVSVATGRPKGKNPRGRSLWGCVKKPSAVENEVFVGRRLQKGDQKYVLAHQEEQKEEEAVL